MPFHTRPSPNPIASNDRTAVLTLKHTGVYRSAKPGNVLYYPTAADYGNYNEKWFSNCTLRLRFHKRSTTGLIVPSPNTCDCFGNRNLEVVDPPSSSDSVACSFFATTMLNRGQSKSSRIEKTPSLQEIAEAPSTGSSALLSITPMTIQKGRIWNLWTCGASCLSPNNGHDTKQGRRRRRRNKRSSSSDNSSTSRSTGSSSAGSESYESGSTEVGLEIGYDYAYSCRRPVPLNNPYPFNRN